MTSIAIIGAGLSGLTAASGLKSVADITLFEKSRGVSGRMSTRRAAPYAFDHGAQFFKARTDAFKAFIAPMIDSGIVARWDARFVEIVAGAITQERRWGEENPHYVGVPGMNALAKCISRGLKVHCGTRVQTISKQGDQWFLQDEQGNSLGSYDWVISSAPAEQAAALLPTSVAFYQQVSSVTMKACFSLMLGFENALPLAFDAARVRGGDISWIALNNSKPQRGEGCCLLVHSTNDWAASHIDDDRDQVLNYLCRQTSALIGHDVSRADHKAVHGWRYANIEKQGGETFLIDPEARVAVCGDWLIEGRVEAAFTSGYELANQMLGVLQDERSC